MAEVIQEGDVTFVDGHAVEQDGSPDSTGDEARDAEKAEAREAVRKALGKAAEDEGEKAAKAVKKSKEPVVVDDEDAPAEAPKAKKPVEEDVDPETASVKQAIKNRERIARIKAEQAAEMARAKAEADQILRQAQAERQAIERERAKFEALRTDPVKAIQEAGWDPEELILNLAKHGTPEGQAELQRRREIQRLQELENWQKSVLEQQRQYQEMLQEQQAVQYRQSVEQQFLSNINEEKTPHLAALYEGREGALVAEGHAVAREYRRLTGKEATVEDIAEYLEEQAAERFSKLSSKRANQTGERRQAVAPVSPPPTGKVARGKTLSGSGSSERRALGKDLGDLEGDERRQAAIAAVKAAMRASATDD